MSSFPSLEDTLRQRLKGILIRLQYRREGAVVLLLLLPLARPSPRPLRQIPSRRRVRHHLLVSSQRALLLHRCRRLLLLPS